MCETGHRSTCMIIDRRRYLWRQSILHLGQVGCVGCIGWWNVYKRLRNQILDLAHIYLCAGMFGLISWIRRDTSMKGVGGLGYSHVCGIETFSNDSLYAYAAVYYVYIPNINIKHMPSQSHIILLFIILLLFEHAKKMWRENVQLAQHQI